jgi:hypothetical protein
MPEFAPKSYGKLGAAREAEKRRFFDLAERLRATHDPDELRQVKDELARITFGS